MKWIVCGLTSVIGLGLMTGCSVTASSNIKSNGIYAANEAASMNGVIVCRTSLKVGGSTGTYIDLDGGDQLYCNGVKMEKSTSVANQISYQATVPAASDFQFELRRTGETLKAYVHMPSAIQGAHLEGADPHVIGQPLSVAWQPSANRAEATSAHLYLENQHRDQFNEASTFDGAPESGRVTFSATDTTVTRFGDDSNHAEHVPGPYNGSVDIVRKLDGALAGAWNGSVIATQTVRLNVGFREP